jgi:hypothetical protein
MSNNVPNAAQHSQIETNAARMRVVILGASNLSLTFRTIVQSALAMFDGPLELFVAKGFGRSYGRDSKFFGKKFPGILQCGIWDALHRAPPLPTVAVVADLGNDLAYEAPVDDVVGWVSTALDRLDEHGARVALNNVPIASLRTVGAARYYLFRELFFPSCKLPRQEMLHRAEQLSDALDRLAEEREKPIFSGEIGWYGLDPIHPRRAAAGEVWQRMLGALRAPEAAPAHGVEVAVRVLPWHRLRPAFYWHFGVARRAAQPCARLVDGSTIAIY